MNRYQHVRDDLRATPRTWLVTGAAGFIGSNLVEALLQLGQGVVGLDNFATGHRRNLDDVRSLVGDDAWERFTLIDGDIRDLATCHVACQSVDLVLHQAALGSVPRSIADPVPTNQVNIDGFLNMLVAARDAEVGRFVYAGSSSTYGDHPDLPKQEANIGRPLSPYAVTKLVDELYARNFLDTYHLETVGLRYFNVFGRRQDPDGAYAAVIPRWIGRLLRGEECVINGDGETSRDFCYIDNVVQANILAAVAPRDQVVGEVFNVAVGGRTTLNELFLAIRDGLAARHSGPMRAEPTYAPFRAGDVRHSQADISKAAAILGYVPSHDVFAGLTEALEWYVDDAERAVVSG